MVFPLVQCINKVIDVALAYAYSNKNIEDRFFSILCEIALLNKNYKELERLLSSKKNSNNLNYFITESFNLLKFGKYELAESKLRDASQCAKRRRMHQNFQR